MGASNFFGLLYIWSSCSSLRGADELFDFHWPRVSASYGGRGHEKWLKLII